MGGSLDINEALPFYDKKTYLFAIFVISAVFKDSVEFHVDVEMVFEVSISNFLFVKSRSLKWNNFLSFVIFSFADGSFGEF